TASRPSTTSPVTSTTRASGVCNAATALASPALNALVNDSAAPRIASSSGEGFFPDAGLGQSIFSGLSSPALNPAAKPTAARPTISQSVFIAGTSRMTVVNAQPGFARPGAGGTGPTPGRQPRWCPAGDQDGPRCKTRARAAGVRAFELPAGASTKRPRAKAADTRRLWHARLRRTDRSASGRGRFFGQ